MKKNFLGLYGNTTILNQYCPKCKTYSFVIKGKLSCCDSPAKEEIISNYKRISNPEQRRRLPSLKERKEQLNLQNYRCFYCDNTFGSVVYKNNKAIKLKIHWDHKIPYSLTQNNHINNFVAACNICNFLKSSKVFQTEDEAKIYLLERWETKGYSKCFD